MSNSTTQLADALINAGVQPRSCGIDLQYANEEKTLIRVSPVGDSHKIQRRFPSQNSLMQEVARKMRQLTSDASWAVREASQVSGLHLVSSSSKLQVAVDFLAPYRSALMDLQQGQTFDIVIMPSRGYFFKRLAPAALPNTMPGIDHGS